MIETLRERNFALVWFGGLVSMLGDWTLRIALPFYVYEVTNSVLVMGVMAMVSTIPQVLVGPIAGVLVDRWDRQSTLVVANLLLCLLLLLLLTIRSTQHIWLVFVVAFLESSIAQFIAPAEHALLPRLVPETHLVPANALNALNNNFAMLIGPVLGGVFMAWFGLRAVIVLDSATYLIAAILFWLVVQPPRSVQPSNPTVTTSVRGISTAWTSMWREWWDGIRVVKTRREIATIFLVTGIVALGEGVFSVLLIPFLQHLGGNAQEFGWLVTWRGVGGLLGGLLIAHIYTLLSPRLLLATSLLSAGLLGVVMVNIPLLLVATVSLCMWGIPAMGAQVSCQTILQRSVTDAYQGRVFSAYGTTAALLLLGGQGIASAVAAQVDLGVLLNVYAGLYVISGVVVVMLLLDSTHPSEKVVEHL